MRRSYSEMGRATPGLVAEAAYDAGDIEELRAIARGNIYWLVGIGIPITLADLGDGIAKIYYDNGRLMGQYTYENGRKHGLCQGWCPNGKPV